MPPHHRESLIFDGGTKMSRRMIEGLKADIGMVGKSLATTNATGRYYDMRNYRTLLVVLIAGAIAITKTVKVELLQATDAIATGAKVITGANATITANTLVTVATVDLTAAANTDTVTVNGVTFTMAAATDVTIREFANAAGLVLCVNSALYGAAGVLAAAAGAVVTLVATDPGEKVITLTRVDVAGTVVVATTHAIAYVEIDVSQLDLANDFTHVAAKVTTTGTTICAVDMLRGIPRTTPTQQVGASAVV